MRQLTALHKIYIYLLVLFLGAIWIWVSAVAPDSTSGGGIPAPHKGFMAPDFNLLSITGETITLSELRGQPVIVNIWASWCPPCRAEMPALEAVYLEYKDRGLVILAVNATSQDDAAEAVSFAQSLGLTFPILFDLQGDISSRYQVQALPSTFFIDTKGIIREVVIGGPMAEALLRIRVEQLFVQEGGPQ